MFGEYIYPDNIKDRENYFVDKIAIRKIFKNGKELKKLLIEIEEYTR